MRIIHVFCPEVSFSNALLLESGRKRRGKWGNSRGTKVISRLSQRLGRATSPPRGFTYLSATKAGGRGGSTN